jgi:cbb3-type cytochrome oxidase maturation protein
VTGLLFLIPIALAMGLVGLVTFLWALRAGQFDDLDGAAGRILFDESEPQRSTPPEASSQPRSTPP